MSKSDADKLSAITILDSADDILNKIKKAKTDFTSMVTYEPDKRPGVSNLVLLQSLITQKSIEQCVQDAAHLNTGQYKLVLGEQLAEYLKPIRLKAEDLQEDRAHLESILKKGSDKARVIAAQTLNEISQLLGFK